MPPIRFLLGAREKSAASRESHIALFDWLRSIAIIGVVLLHTAAWNWTTTPVTSAAWQTLNVIDSGVRFCVPVFFMVSGALFLNPARVVTLRSILTKSLPRIVIPFLVWSFGYACLDTFGPGGDGSLLGFLSRIVLGHYHLWFLIALAGLYLAAPVLRPIARDRRLAWYFVILAGFFATVLPLMEKAPLAGPILTRFLSTMQFDIVLGYSAYFVLGHLLFTATIPNWVVLGLGCIGVASYAATAVGTTLLSSRAGSADELLYGYLTPNVLLMSVAVFVVARRHLERRKPIPRAAPAWVRVLAQASFGVYLVHPLLQSIYAWLGFTSAILNPAASVPLVALAIGLPSLVLAVALSRIPRVGRWVS